MRWCVFVTTINLDSSSLFNSWLLFETFCKIISSVGRARSLEFLWDRYHSVTLQDWSLQPSILCNIAMTSSVSFPLDSSFSFFSTSRSKSLPHASLSVLGFTFNQTLAITLRHSFKFNFLRILITSSFVITFVVSRNFRSKSLLYRRLRYSITPWSVDLGSDWYICCLL